MITSVEIEVFEKDIELLLKGANSDTINEVASMAGEYFAYTMNRWIDRPRPFTTKAFVQPSFKDKFKRFWGTPASTTRLEAIMFARRVQGKYLNLLVQGYNKAGKLQPILTSQGKSLLNKYGNYPQWLYKSNQQLNPYTFADALNKRKGKDRYIAVLSKSQRFKTKGYRPKLDRTRTWKYDRGFVIDTKQPKGSRFIAIWNYYQLKSNNFLITQSRAIFAQHLRDALDKTGNEAIGRIERKEWRPVKLV